LTNAAAAPALDKLGDSSAGNADYVLGRYAYVVYQVGGLLDINAAGSDLAASQKRLKGRTLTADLQEISAIFDPQSFLQWRWPITGTNASTTAPGLLAPARNFDRVEAANLTGSEQLFVDRQDLLKYQKANPSQIGPEALPFLTVFSRESNAPTAKPGPDAVNNPGLLEVVWDSDFTLPEGINVKAGTPITDPRFPLSRLALVSDSATATADNATDEIYRNFGLTRAANTLPWTYNHGNPTKILTLSEVIALKRRPDFFELLKAAIHSGSIGKAGFIVGNPEDMTKSAVRDSIKDVQILQIGANLLDQADADSYPTPVQFGSEAIYGIEDLPYIYSIYSYVYRPVSGNNATRDTAGLWFVPSLWNPHQVTGAASPISNLRFSGSGLGPLRLGAPFDPAWGSGLQKIVYENLPIAELQTQPPITFPNSYRDPKLLRTAAGEASSSGANLLEPTGDNLVGIFGDSSVAPDSRITYVTDATNQQWSAAAPIFLDRENRPVAFALEYDRGGGDWRPYQKLGGFGYNVLWNAPPYPHDSAFRTPYPIYVFQKADPRTNRFGANNVNSELADGRSLRGTRAGLGWQWDQYKPTAFASTSPGTLAENLTGTQGFYADPDGVVRPGDAKYGSYPQAESADADTPSRPIILNRPFRSVGEMSYAFRDLPWKTLDFFSDQSADARLLDVFSIDEGGVVAGKVDLNTPHASVITSLLSGGGLNLANTTTSLSSGNAATLAQAIVANGPYENLGDLIKKLAPTYPFSATSDLARLKHEREIVARALGSATQTRTWNVMIDIICQTGKYPRSPTSLNDFTVEGEHRVWVHLAIDRFSGKIIERSVERVSQ